MKQMLEQIAYRAPDFYYQRIDELLSSADPEVDAKAIDEAKVTIRDCRPGGRFTTEELPPAGAPNFVLERTLARAVQKLEDAISQKTAPTP